MHWWQRFLDGPLDGPPPPEVYNADVTAAEPTRPRLVSVNEVSEWMSAAEEREFLVWKEIDALLTELAFAWPWRTRQLRRELRWLRSEAKRHGYRWGA